MKILIMCEGPNELKIVNLLLDNGKLKFTRDDLLDMRPFHARQLTSPQLKPALDYILYKVNSVYTLIHQRAAAIHRPSSAPIGTRIIFG